MGLAALMPLLSIITPQIESEGSNRLLKWFLSALLLYVMWHGILVVKHWRLRHQSWVALSIVICFTGLLTALLILYGQTASGELNWGVFIRIAFSSLIILVIQHTLSTQEQITKLMVERQQLKTENLKTQLKELRSQMDPHFFFNALNTLRSMVRQNHENSEKFIIGLSDFYRQLLKYNKDTTLPLEEELKVLESYLFLMKNRNDKALITNLEEIDPRYGQYQIPTLALQSVVENCFKHNSMTSKMPLKIDVRTTLDGYIEVKNNLQPKLSPEKTSGVGLDILRKRYQILNVIEGVVIESCETSFSVKMWLINSK